MIRRQNIAWNMKEEYLTGDTIKAFARETLEEVKPYQKDYGFFLEKDRIALLVIDMQNYFLNPRAHGYIPSAEAIIPNVNRLQNYFLTKNMPVYLTQHINNEDDAGMMRIRWKEVITAHHPFASLADEVNLPGCKIIRKTQFDAFYESELEHGLRDLGISQLIITGVMANLCCETTVRSAFVRGFEPVMPVDATAAYNYDFHLSTFRNLTYGFMQAMSTEQVINMLSR
jgi:isochorismate hydrolase